VLFSIRDFQPPDFETLWRIDQQCFAPGISYSRPELAAYMRMAGSFTLVAQVEKTIDPTAQTESLPPILEHRVLGFVVGTNKRGAGHIVTIDVLPTVRRTGVGSRLLEAAEHKLRALGSRMVGLETAVNNAPALAFYKRQGYTINRTIPRYYPDGVDAFVMTKDLLSEPLADNLRS
jgi:ribosomal-protein-alanine N-acetyltransferase